MIKKWDIPLKSKVKKEKLRFSTIISLISLFFILFIVLYFMGQILLPHLFSSTYYLVEKILFSFLGISFILFLVLICINVLGFSPLFINLLNLFYKKNKRIFKVANISLASFLLCLILVIAVFDLISPIEKEQDPEGFTVLYADVYGPASKNLLKAGFTPLALYLKQINEKVAILPFNESNLKNALVDSKYLFIASHGYDGYLFSGPDKAYSYMDFANYKKSNLEFVYFSACGLGVDDYSEQWRRIMSPASIIIYDRDSAIMEHVIWILFKSIDALKELNNHTNSEYDQEVSLTNEIQYTGR